MLAKINEDVKFVKITRKTSVLSGVDDPLRTPASVKKIADRIPGSDYRELNASHFLSVSSSDL